MLGPPEGTSLQEAGSPSLTVPQLGSLLSSDAFVRRILDMARETLDLDVVHLSEFENGTQVFRAISGDAGSFGFAVGGSVELADSYCQRLIDGRIGSVVADTSAHEELRDLVTTRQAGLRAYVGVPIRLHDGSLFGTLCGLDHDPAPHLTAEHVRTLEFLGRVITEFLEREEAARRANWLTALLERIPLVVYEALPGHRGRWTFVTPQIEDLLGLSVDQVLGEPMWWSDRIHPADRDAVHRYEASATRAPGSTFRCEYRMVTASGSVRWVRDEARFETAYDGSLRMRGYLLDVTDQRQHEDDLREAASFLRALLDSMSQAVVACDSAGRLSLMNRAARTLHGVEAVDRLESTSWSTTYDLYARNEDTPLRTEDVPLVRALRGEVFEDLPLTVKRPGLRPVHLVVAGRPIVDGAEEKLGAVVVMQDVSDLLAEQEHVRDLQGQLAQAEKLEAIGRVAGSIAHDFNNILNVMVGHADLLHTEVTDPQHREDAQVISAAGRKGAEIVRQLMRFARHEQVASLHVVSLNDIFAGLEPILKPLSGQGIQLNIDCPDGICVVGDEVQLSQALMNLVVNAGQAMDGRGALDIEIRRRRLDEVIPTSTGPLGPGDFVSIDVIDSGPGIAPDALERVFEPFFTTKAEGAGTGLGLATVYAAVKSAGGGVLVESEPGHGARFTLILREPLDKGE